MAIEPWLEHPIAYDKVQSSIFFDELKVNLENVTRDYVGLGVEDEQEMIADIKSLFNQHIVPSRSDWAIIESVLHKLAQVKEFSTMHRDFFGDVADSLGVSDLANIRDFLDRIQSIPPRPGTIVSEIPAPNITTLNIPTLSSANSFKTSMTVAWTINQASLALKSGTIIGERSISEDVSRYDLAITAGTYTNTVSFLPTANITTSFNLNWAQWFTLSQIKLAKLSATLTTVDKRGNASSSSLEFKYPSSVRMQVPIKSYQLQYKIDNNAWVQLAYPTALNYTWTNIPEKTGTYTFRVRGLDQLDAWAEWVQSVPRFIEYIIPPPPPPKPPIPPVIPPKPPVPQPPKAPDKPAPVATPNIYQVTTTWKAVARAEKYIAWIGPNEATAKANTKGNDVFWVELNSNQTRSVVFKILTSDTPYKVSVRAENKGGTNTGTTNTRTLKRTLKKTTYKPIGHEVWNGQHYFRSWPYSTYGHNWRSDAWKETKNSIYHGGWEEVDIGGGWWGYHWRSGRAYQSYNYQNWGNNMSFLFYNYELMRSQLAGKQIKDVKINLSRTTSIHGHQSAIPLYLYNHNRENSKSRTAANAFSLYRADNRAEVNYNNQRVAYNYQVSRGQNFDVTNDWSKQLVQNMVNGTMRGLGMVKYYGNNNPNWKGKVFYTKPNGQKVIDVPMNGDKAYMVFNPNATTIEVTYYDN